MAPPAAKILSGKAIAAREREACRLVLAAMKTGKVVLATVQVGDGPEIKLYAEYLKDNLKAIGIKLVGRVFPSQVSEALLAGTIKKLNKDKQVTGIMIFSPLPKHIDPARVFDRIDALKDVEGRTFLKSHYGVFSPTAHAVLLLIEESGLDLTGKEAVVVGHSDLVGKPTAVLLADRMATVTLCHHETKDLKSHIGRADVLVVAVGKPHLIKGSWIKPGAVVIDVGENVLGGKTVGDVEFEAALTRASHITPVPGGVGPVTNIMLIKNLLNLYRLQQARHGNR